MIKKKFFILYLLFSLDFIQLNAGHYSKKHDFINKDLAVPLIVIGAATMLPVLLLVKEYIRPKPPSKRRASYIGYMEISGPIESVGTYIKQIEYFSNESICEGLFVFINSNGGSPGPAELIMRELLEFRSKNKFVIVGVENQCLSAAYLIASAADLIIVPETSSIGSIGTVLYKYLYKELPGAKSNELEGGKIAADYYCAGKYKVTGDPLIDLSDEQKAYVQSLVDRSYIIFCSIIAKNRKLDLDKVAVWADGKIFNGKEAVQDLGLADEIGSISTIKNKFKELIQKKEPSFDGDIIFVSSSM